MCLYPRIMKNPKYKGTKKNGGYIPPVSDKRVTVVPIGCGNCIECRKQKAREWQLRLMEDIKENKNGKFVTLTFSNESIRELNEKKIKIIDKESKQKIEINIDDLKGYEKDNAIATIGIRLFLERWRKEHKKSVRHWLVTEIGHNGTENIHMHGIIWTNEKIEEIKNKWKYGYVYPRTEEENKMNYVSERTINYIIKYITKKDEKNTTYKSIILTSAGIGRNYTETPDAIKNRYKQGGTNETYRTRTGHKMAMPIYWRNKIYTEEEREKLWIEKLDKEERWVRGEKIDISKGEEEYYKVLKWHRERNKELGYGDDKINWNRAEYEKQRRIIMTEKRIKKPPVE